MLSKAGLLLFHLFPCCSASPPLGISHKLSLPKAKFTWSALPPSRMLPCGSLNEPQNHETSELGTLESCPASLTIHGAPGLLHWAPGRVNLAPRTLPSPCCPAFPRKTSGSFIHSFILAAQAVKNLPAMQKKQEIQVDSWVGKIP